ncbi:MAG: hypothetical protein ACW9W3_00995 [Candidatus Nitrosopumilus sp. bin_68KS]
MRKAGKGKGFHPNILKEYLKQMELEGLITVEKIGNKLKISRVDQDFEKKIKSFLKNTEKIETRSFKKTNNEENFIINLEYFSNMLEKYRELILGELFAICVISNKYKIQEIEKAKERILDLMIEKFGRLEDDDKQRMLDRLLNRY